MAYKRDLSTPLAETFPTRTKTKTRKGKTITKTKTKKGGYVTKTKKVDGKEVKKKSRKTIQKAYIDAEFRSAERKKARVKRKRATGDAIMESDKQRKSNYGSGWNNY